MKIRPEAEVDMIANNEPTSPTFRQSLSAGQPQVPPNAANRSLPSSEIAHRSHDPTKNGKRSDPFKFGSRYLEEGDDVFEFNAWDHVIPDEHYYAFAEEQYANQRSFPVCEFDKRRFNSEPAKWWNKFYSNNTSNFFKNRKWLLQEFPVLSRLTTKEAGPARILEVGAGAGNTAFPILAANENAELVIHACDFSNKAVDLVKTNAAYDAHRIQASVWDISSDDLPQDVPEGSVDVVLLIFIFSALSPTQWSAAVRNVWKLLKPGGEVCFRDYGRGDLTQVRFKKGRLMEESFYIRGDGTRVYFFDEDELGCIWRGNMLIDTQDRVKEARIGVSGVMSHERVSSFEISSLGVDRRMLVNRQKQLKMYRCWLQGRFLKPLLPKQGGKRLT